MPSPSRHCVLSITDPGYAGPLQTEHPTIAAAHDAFLDHLDDPLASTPDQITGHLYLDAHLPDVDPLTAEDPYPDRELTVGPRGGLRSTTC